MKLKEILMLSEDSKNKETLNSELIQKHYEAEEVMVQEPEPVQVEARTENKRGWWWGYWLCWAYYSVN
jgi:hypothetical protein